MEQRVPAATRLVWQPQAEQVHLSASSSSIFFLFWECVSKRKGHTHSYATKRKRRMMSEQLISPRKEQQQQQCTTTVGPPHDTRGKLQFVPSFRRNPDFRDPVTKRGSALMRASPSFGISKQKAKQTHHSTNSNYKLSL